ncbi:hypothetical protein BGY98DRAFT_986979 [Russula aff. rugulosa BPL654]|nr:hypothetical protein BGY98DRAFT_986979 [Russula aff. rugulosa BPL654]
MLWYGDFDIAQLGGVTGLNIQRLVYRPFDDLQPTVQHRVLDILAQQIMLCEVASNVSMELRRR